MNILEVVYSLGIGGTERTAENFALGLKNADKDVRVFTLQNGIRRKTLDAATIPVYFSFHELKEISFTWTPDIIHIHNHGITINTQKKICEIFPNAQICEQNVFSIPSGYTKLDISFQLSKWCKWNYLNHNYNHSYPTHLINILPNPVNPNNFFPITTAEKEIFRRRYGIPTDAIVLLRIGQPFIAKWNTKMIDVFIDLHKKYETIFLLCVGAPQNVIQYAKTKGKFVKDILFIEQLVGDDNLRLCYGASDIFLHIARIGESFGLVLAEAMLCELPVVTINTPYCDNTQSEIVINSKGGFVANKYKGIISATSRLIENEFLRKEMGKFGRKSILERFTIDKIIKIFIQTVETEKLTTQEKIINSSDIYNYLSKAIDKPIPFVAQIFKAKKYILKVCPEKYYRYLFRLWCRLFDKSVQL